MRALRAELSTHEDLLYLFFSDLKDTVLADNVREQIDKFFRVCKAQDAMEGTNVAETAAKLYSAGRKATVQEIKERTNLSDASLYRFRVKMADKLKTYLSR